MGKATTEQIEASENKHIIEKIDYLDFRLVCEELNVVEEAIRKLWELAVNTDDDKLRTDIYKWVIEMNVGKAKQKSEIEGNVNMPSLIVGDIKDIE